LFVSIAEDESSPQYGAVNCILQDADAISMTPAGIRCRRTTAGTDTAGSTGEIHVRWTVASFTSGVTVHRGQANTGFTNPSTLPLATPVDPSSSFVVLTGIDTGGGGWGSNEFQRATLVDAQTIDLRTNVAGSEVAWQVVTVTGVSVQRGSTSLGSAD